jgi:hypothetical protein
MKNAWITVAVTSLLLAAGPGRSQDAGMTPRLAVPDVPAGAFETTEHAPGAKCLTLQQRLQEWGKVRPASHSTTTPEEPTPPSPSLEAVPPGGMLSRPFSDTGGVPSLTGRESMAPSPTAPLGAPCLTGPRHRCFWEQLNDWLTYRPLSHDVCDCFPKCVPCCDPRLYTFFIGACCVNPTGAGCRPVCAHDGCCRGGARCAGLWQGVRNCRLWHGWDDLLFYHGKDCAHGTCGPDDGLADMNTK